MQCIHLHSVTHNLEPDNLCLFPSASLPGTAQTTSVSGDAPPKSYTSRNRHRCVTQPMKHLFFCIFAQIHSADYGSQHFPNPLLFTLQRLPTLNSHPFPLCATGNLLPVQRPSSHADPCTLQGPPGKPFQSPPCSSQSIFLIPQWQ